MSSNFPNIFGIFAAHNGAIVCATTDGGLYLLSLPWHFRINFHTCGVCSSAHSLAGGTADNCQRSLKNTLTKQTHTYCIVQGFFFSVGVFGIHSFCNFVWGMMACWTCEPDRAQTAVK